MFDHTTGVPSGVPSGRADGTDHSVSGCTTRRPDPGAALHRAAEITGAVVSDDVAHWDDPGLLAAFTQVEAARRALDATVAHLAHELDRRGATQTTDGLPTRGWIAWRHGLPRRDAAALVRVGAFLSAHPVLEQALVDGGLSIAHVELLARACTPRVAAVVDLIQQELVDLAEGTRFEVWARDVRALLDLADADGGHRPGPEDNHLTVASGAEGDVVIRGSLVGEWAAEFRAALDAEADRLFRVVQQDWAVTSGESPVVGRPQLLAMALVELVRQGRAAGRHGAAPLSDVTVVLTTPPELPAALLRPAAEQTQADWLASLTAAALAAHTIDGHPVAPTTAGLLCCDASVRILVESFTGETLALGRSQRLASRAQRRAAALRYGGCCFPGCDAPPSWTELHHTPSWEAGGSTDLPHLAPLCRHHHGTVHRTGWGIQPSATHGFVVTTPAGRTLPVQQRGRVPGRLRS